jgi:hypothetical protein
MCEAPASVPRIGKQIPPAAVAHLQPDTLAGGIFRRHFLCSSPFVISPLYSGAISLLFTSQSHLRLFHSFSFHFRLPSTDLLT